MCAKLFRPSPPPSHPTPLLICISHREIVGPKFLALEFIETLFGHLTHVPNKQHAHEYPKISQGLYMLLVTNQSRGIFFLHFP